MQMKPDSNEQVGEHPSFGVKFESSHVSKGVMMIPSPQTGAQVLGQFRHEYPASV